MTEQQMADSAKSDTPPQDTSAPFLTTRHIEAKSELAPGNYATVHADKLMIGIDHQTSVATLTFLNSHPIPQVRPNGPWDLQNVMWDIVGEIKISLAAVSGPILYYLSVLTNGLDITPIINKHLQDHPQPPAQGYSYGPLFLSSQPPKQPDTQTKRTQSATATV